MKLPRQLRPGCRTAAEVAHAQKWWTNTVGIDHLIADRALVQAAVSLGQDPLQQCYTIGDIDENRITKAVNPY